MNLGYLGRLYAKTLPLQLAAFAIAATAMFISSVIPLRLGDCTNSIERMDLESLNDTVLNILLLSSAIFILYFLSKLLYNFNARDIEVNLRRFYFERLLGAHEIKLNPGDVTTRFLDDVSMIRQVIAYGVPEILNVAALTVFSLYMMIQLHLTLALISLIALLLTACNICIFYPKIYRISKEWLKRSSALYDTAFEAFYRYKDTKIKGSEDEKQRLFTESSERYKSSLIDSVRTSSKFQLINRLISTFSIGMILFAASPDFFKGDLQLGTLVAFLGYQMILSNQLVSIGSIILMVFNCKVSLERLDEIIANGNNATDNTTNNPAVGSSGTEATDSAIAVRGGIRISDLDIELQNRKRLQVKNCELEPGKKYGIIGKTGAGKTALLRCLAGDFTIPPGSIYLGGHDIASIPTHTLRRIVTIVPQEVVLFTNTVRYNVSFPRPDASLSSVQQKCEIAEVHEEVLAFPAQYEQVVGERGLRLSAGQKQRLAIARALLHEFQILLFDEPFANVDSQTEHEIINNLFRELEGKTVIIVTNRLSVMPYLDEVLVIDEGKLAARGTHSALLKESPIYEAMYRSFTSLDYIKET